MVRILAKGLSKKCDQGVDTPHAVLVPHKERSRLLTGEGIAVVLLYIEILCES